MKELNIKYIYFYSIGCFLIFLSNQIKCDENITGTVSTTTPKFESTVLTTTTVLTSTRLPSKKPEPHTSTSTTIRPTKVESDVAVIELTTTLERLCLTKSTSDDDYSIESLAGDIIVTFITRVADNASSTISFMVNHINQIDLLSNNVTLGVRIIKLHDARLKDVLLAEIDYLEQCVEHPFGIFLTNELWSDNKEKIKSLEFKIWPMPSTVDLKFRKIAHLLNELPWGNQNSSLDIRADSESQGKLFKDTLKLENFCIKIFSSDDKIVVVIGDVLNITTFSMINIASLIIVPLNHNHIVMNDIPNGSFLALENEFDHKGHTILASNLITVSSTLLEITKATNNAIWKNCNKTDDKYHLSQCDVFFYDDLTVPTTIPTYDIKIMLKLMQLDALQNSLNYNLYQKFASKIDDSVHSIELKKLSTTNFVTNITTVYTPGLKDSGNIITLGSLFPCSKHKLSSHKNITNEEKRDHHQENAFNLDEGSTMLGKDPFDQFAEMSWQIKTELWIAIGLTVSTLGILLCLAILTFISIRICMDDVLEGNPIGSVLLIIALILQFATFFPFTIEYASYPVGLRNHIQDSEVWNSMCAIKIFLISVSYCLTFSLLLCRAIMLASIGSEGGFLSHVNGYIQSIICVFSFLVQVGLSTQLLILMHTNAKNITCENVFYGNWFWGIVAYDGILLMLLIFLSPLIFRSQRNYREGILLVVSSILCLVIWTVWIPLSMLGDTWREMAVPLGVQATAWVILASLLVPRCFLIVKSIARSDFAQALPSLTSLAFAQTNQYISEPSIYECVNPTMRSQHRSSEDMDQTETTHLPNDYPSPSEVPTLPMRSGMRRNLIEHYNLNFNEMVNPELPSPNKITRF